MYEFRRPQSGLQETRSLSGLNPEERYAWEERVAICTLDGRLPEARAQEIAWCQIERQRAAKPDT